METAKPVEAATGFEPVMEVLQYAWLAY